MIKEKKQTINAGRVGAIAVAALMVSIALIFFAMFSLASYMDERLQGVSEQHVLDATGQMGDMVSQRMIDTRSAVNAFSIQTDDLQEVVPALASLCDNLGLTRAAFFNMQKEGILQDGSPVTLGKFPVEDVALSDAEIARDTFQTGDGSFMQVGQRPVYIDGEQVGALYIEFPINMFVPTGGGGEEYSRSMFIFDTTSGTVLGERDTDNVLPPLGSSLYEYVALAIDTQAADDMFTTRGTSTSAVTGVEEMREAIDYKASAIAVGILDKEEYFICVAPIGDWSWYVGEVIPVDDVRADASIASSVLGIVFALVVGCLVLGVVVAVQLYRRESQSRTNEMNNHLYQALSDSLDFSVNLYCPADGKVTQIVAKTVDIFGITLESLIHQPDLVRKLNMSPQGRAMLLEVRDGVNGSTVLKGTFSFQDIYDNSRHYVEYVVRPLRYMDKDQMLVLLRDVSSEKVIENSMKEAMDAAEAANSAKSDFLLRMSHEIRTPMNVIIGKIAIARKNLGNKEKIEKSLVDIEQASDHLLQLINEVLDISKIESGKLDFVDAPYNLHELVNAINTMFEPQCAAKDLEYSCTVDGQVDDNFIGDVMRMRQVLMNLLSNAVKYTPRGGHVRFGVRVGKSHANGYRSLEFTVKDDGIGMTKDYLERIYEPFAQEGRVKSEGTGLGMSIVKNIVNSMGGGIHVESKVNEGTTITVALNQRRFTGDVEEVGSIATATAARLIEAGDEDKVEVSVEQDGTAVAEVVPEAAPGAAPDGTAESNAATAEEAAGAPTTHPGMSEAAVAVADAEAELAAMLAANSEELPDPSLYDFTNIRALLVEDSELNAEIVNELLSDEGITIEWAEDGQVGYEKFVESEEGYYDVVLMDIRMPNMNGYEATVAIRALDRPDAGIIPIIAMSANAFADDVLMSLKSGMNAHLSKPISIKEVLATVAVELEKSDNPHLKRRS